jgi:hypothetical protein
VAFCEKLDFEHSLTENCRVLVINPLSSIWSHEITAEATFRSFEKTKNVFWLNASTNFPKEYHVNSKDYLPRWYFRDLSRELAKIFTLHGIKADGKSLRVTRSIRTPHLASIDELKELQKDNLRIGAMIYSSISSARGTTSLEITEIRDHFNYLFRFAEAASTCIRNAILEFKPTLILTTNDRLIPSAMAVALAKEFEIDSRIVYWGSESNTIQDYVNSLYDGSEWQKYTELKWRENPPNGLERILLRSELSELAGEPSKDSKSYLHGQALGKVPEIPEKSLVFYAQSEHEHSPNLLNIYKDRFSNQYEAFDTLQKVAHDLGWTVYLKYHPLKDLPAASKGFEVENVDWRSIKLLDNVIEIPSTSDVDTYALIGQSSFNVVWSSTVGLESIMRGHPILVLGNPHWLNLNWKIHAWDGAAIRGFLQENRSDLDQDSLLPWNWYLKGYGSRSRFSIREQENLKVVGCNVLKLRFYVFALRVMKRAWESKSR